MGTCGCVHPPQLHADDRCAVLHCSCRIVISLARCRCPYRDCWNLIDTTSGLCPTCEQVCVPAHGMEDSVRTR